MATVNILQWCLSDEELYINGIQYATEPAGFRGDKGILDNGRFMMLEINRKQVFHVICGWLEKKIPA